MSKCWAASLGNCSSNVSGEHLVSKCLFKDKVTIQGFPWLKGTTKTIGINSLVANTLCQKHNSDLSDYDSAACDTWLLATEHLRLANVRKQNQRNKGKWSVKRFEADGLRFERWCLKTMTTMFVSGNITQVVGWSPPQGLIDIIFSSQRLAPGAGVGFIASVGDRHRISESIQIFPLFFNKSPIGCLMDFRGICVVVTWAFPVEKVPIPIEVFEGKQGSGFPMYHLKRMDGSDLNTSLDFRWNGQPFNAKREKSLQILRDNYRNS